MGVKTNGFCRFLSLRFVMASCWFCFARPFHYRNFILYKEEAPPVPLGGAVVLGHCEEEDFGCFEKRLFGQGLGREKGKKG